jgi:hypothetical protein
VVCALKAHQANTSAPDFAPLLGPSTSVVRRRKYIKVSRR